MEDKSIDDCGMVASESLLVSWEPFDEFGGGFRVDEKKKLLSKRFFFLAL